MVDESGRAAELCAAIGLNHGMNPVTKPFLAERDAEHGASELNRHAGPTREPRGMLVEKHSHDEVRVVRRRMGVA